MRGGRVGRGGFEGILETIFNEAVFNSSLTPSLYPPASLACFPPSPSSPSRDVFVLKIVKKTFFDNIMASITDVNIATSLLLSPSCVSCPVCTRSCTLDT